MSQWAQIQQNPVLFRQMQQCYPQHFPMEVRYFLCQWIEEQAWELIEENNTEHVPVAEDLLATMLNLLQQKACELNSEEFFLIKYKLEESYTRIQSLMESRPLELVQTIKNCLAREAELIRQAEGSASEIEMLNQNLQAEEGLMENEKIQCGIDELINKTQSTDKRLRLLQQKQESFIIMFSDSQRLIVQKNQLSQTMNKESPEFKQKENQLKNEKEKIEQQLTQLANDLLCMRIELSSMYEQTINNMEVLQKEVLDVELLSWKRQQQLVGNGLVMNTSGLVNVHKWCDHLADITWQNRQQVKKLTQLQRQLPIKDPEGKEDLLPKLNDAITNLLSSLITSTFVVEKQPPQVLKKDSRFSAAVTLLVGGRLNVHMNQPQVKVSIISEQQANKLLNQNSDFKDSSSGDILNNTGTMECQPNTGYLGITFRNMQLKKIKRANKKGSEFVTEEKFCLFFQSEFNLGGNDLAFKLWTLSLPVVVTVHGNQECNAMATVLWDNAFAEPGRLPFVVPDQVEWTLLADQLSLKFMYATGRSLNQASLNYLASKLFGDKDPSVCNISWAQFNKESLSNRSFTFWEWFYAILKLTKEHLKDLWMDNAIIGFISKVQAQTMLSGQPAGTFLLRFSDSEIGGITIACTNEKKEVFNLAPSTSKDFNIRGLADRIKDLDQLISLYPNKDKDLVFSKYYTATDEKMDPRGYVCPTLKATIPNQYSSPTDVEIKQPFSQEYLYDSNLNSVHSIEEGPYMEIYDDDFANLDMLTDYIPDDIDELNDTNVTKLIASHNLSG